MIWYNIRIHKDTKYDIISIIFYQNNVSKVINTFGAKNLNDAVELVSMLGETAQPANQNTSTTSTNQNVSSTSSNNQTAPFEPSSAILTSSQMRSSITTPKTTTTTAKDLFFRPLLLCDGITELLKSLVSSEIAGDASSKNIFNAADLLMLSVNALVLETSLFLKVQFL